MLVRNPGQKKSNVGFLYGSAIVRRDFATCFGDKAVCIIAVYSFDYRDTSS
jgi:hypothetical protein